MDEFCGRLVNRYFDAALEAVDGSREMDDAAVHAAGDRDGDWKKRSAALAYWIRQYKVHRVKWIAEDDKVPPTFADAVAKGSIGLFDRWGDARVGVVEAYAELREVIGDLHKGNGGKERSFRSLTAKVLWCRYPDAVPIYDLFASEAVTFLAKAYKAYEARDSYARGKEEGRYDNKIGYVNWKTADRATKDIWWYKDFHNAHSVLFQRFEPHIEDRLTSQSQTPSSFRVFDKILWLFGNHDLDYSLMHLPRTTHQGGYND